MKEQIEQCLQELRLEFESSPKMLAETEAKEAELKRTLLRMSGAIEMLQEELAKCEENASEAETSEVSSAGEPENQETNKNVLKDSYFRGVR